MRVTPIFGPYNRRVNTISADSVAGAETRSCHDGGHSGLVPGQLIWGERVRISLGVRDQSVVNYTNRVRSVGRIIRAVERPTMPRRAERGAREQWGTVGRRAGARGAGGPAAPRARDLTRPRRPRPPAARPAASWPRPRSP